MSAGPYTVLSQVWIGPPNTFQPGSVFIRPGTVVFLDPASTLGGQYGGPSNLQAVPETGSQATADHAALGN